MLQSLFDLEGFVWEAKPTLLGANKENHDLDISLKEKKAELQRLKGTLEMESDRGKRLSAYCNDLQLDKDFTERKRRAQHDELEADENAKKTYNRDMEHMKQDMGVMKNELNSLKKRQNIRETNIRTQTEMREALKTATQMEEEALMQWLKDSSQFERDKLALTKYVMEDTAKLREINLTLEKMGKDTRECKTTLDNTDTDLFVAQTELDKIQQEFGKAHKERQIIIEDWEKVLLSLQRRNEEIDELTKHMDDMNTEEKALNSKLLEQRQLYASELYNNKELASKVTKKEEYASAIRRDVKDAIKFQSDADCELESLQGIAMRVQHQVWSMRLSINLHGTQIEERVTKMKHCNDGMTLLNADIEKLKKDIEAGQMSIEELEKLFSKDKALLRECEHRFKTATLTVAKASQELLDANNQERVKESDLKGMQATNRNLRTCNLRLDMDRIEQQKLLATINSTIRQTEQRVKNMEGDTSNEEEKWRLENQKSKLQRFLDHKMAALDFLTVQVKTMMERITVAIRKLDLSRKQNGEVSERIEFLEYFIANSMKAFNRERERKKNLLVDDCLTNLHLNRYKNLLKQRNETVLDLQRIKVEFEAVIKTRLLDLKACKDMMFAEMRRHEEECCKINRDVKDCCNKLEKYQKRYDIILLALGLTDVGEHPEMYTVLKNEDEIRKLQQKRDELICKVVHDENEMHLLKNTLLAIQMVNEQFRQQLHPPGLSPEQNEQLRSAEWAQQQIDIELLKCLRKQQDLVDDLEEVNSKLQKLPTKLSALHDTLNYKYTNSESLDKEINDLDVKLNRAEKTGSRVKIKTDALELEEDMKLNLLVEMRKSVADQLFTIASGRPDMFSHLKVSFERFNIPLPPQARVLIPSRSSSQFSSQNKLGSSASSGTSMVDSTGSTKNSRSVLTPTVVSPGSDL